MISLFKARLAFDIFYEVASPAMVERCNWSLDYMIGKLTHGSAP